MRTRTRSRLVLAAVAVVPLAFAGLFVGSIGNADEGVDRIPAVVVNQDQLVTQTAEDGSETPVFAGRQLVTELTSGDSGGFDWTISNADDAEAALVAGDVHAVLTVPHDFSASILSLQSDNPRSAELSIRTDDAHSYLSGTVAGSVGEGLASAFGREITAQYISGIYSSIGSLGESLGAAADGARELENGAIELGDGLGGLSEGAESARAGADILSDGVAGFAGGVRSLSTGLTSLDRGSAGLSGISDGVDSYSSGVSQLSAAIAAASANLGNADPVVAATARGTVVALSAELESAAAGGSILAARTDAGIRGIQSGIAQSAVGASQLAANSGPLTAGASALAGGLGEISSGAAAASSGSAGLAAGAGQLAAGLQSGAEQVPSMDATAGARAADSAVEPVELAVERDNPITDIGQLVASVLVPLGLWVGALGIFLVLPGVSRAALASTAADGRVLALTLGRAATVAVGQAVLLVAMLHLALETPWTLLPATLGFALVMALAFTAFHGLLTLAFGRAGLVVSLFAIAVQLAATGGLYPVELLAAPFQAISPLLPLTHGVAGMQQLLAGGQPSTVVVAALALLAFGVGSALVSLFVVRGTRRRMTLLPA
jgi:putative membrane protein